MPKKKTFPPDWREESAYPDPKKTSSDRWAWEFLRRNSDYQKDYKTLIEASKSKASLNRPNGYGFGKFAHDPTPHLNETYDEYCIRMKKEDIPSIRSEPLSHYLTTKWKLDKLIDPFKNTAKFSQSDFVREVGFDGGFDGVFDEHENAILSFLSKNEIALSFDLRQPTKVLLSEAKSILDKYRKDFKNKEKETRQYRHLYPEYIRLLDAMDGGATNKEMGKAIYPKATNNYPKHNRDQKVRDSLKKAKQLRDSPQLLTYYPKPKK
jgi:hypothetical protein